MSKEPIMQKLKNIPKKNIYEVPEGYFDKLPGIIQARVMKESPKQEFIFSWFTALKYALPVLLIGVAGFFWYSQTTQPEDANSILASIETEDLVAYINSSEITTDELLDAFSLDTEEISNIENEVYGGGLSDDDLDALMDEFDIDLNNL
jgi:hypothetical protein